MAAPKLSETVSSPDGGETWDFHCNYPSGCGDDPLTPGSPGLVSTGWPTPQIAKDRGKLHYAEHETGKAMLSLHEFREKHGLVSSHEGARAVKK